MLVVALAPDLEALPDPPNTLALLEADVGIPVPVPVPIPVALPVAEDPEAENETVEETFEVVWLALSKAGRSEEFSELQ